MIYIGETEVRSQKPEARSRRNLFSCLLPLTSCLLFFQPAFAEDSPLKESLRLMKQGDYQNAIQVLNIVREKNSGSIWEKRATYLLGYACLKSGQFDDALKYFKRTSEEYLSLSDYAEYNAAVIYSEKGDHSMAVDALDSFLHKYPFTRLAVRAGFDRANNIFMMNNYSEALTEIRSFIAKFPSDKRIPEAYYILGKSLEQMGNRVDAYKAYQFIYYNYPLNNFAEMALSRMMEIKKDESVKFPPPDDKEEIKRIDELMNGKKYGDAVKELLEMSKRLKDSPSGETVLFKLAAAYKFMGNDSKCVQTLRKFIMKFNKSQKIAEALYMLSKIYWNTLDTKKSILYNNIIILKYPESIWAGKAMYVNARIAEDEGRADDAIMFYSRLIGFTGAMELAEESAWRIGWVYYSKGEYYKSVESFRKSIEQFPDSQYTDSSLYWMGRGGENAGDSEIAIYAYKKLIMDYPYTYYGYRGYERLAVLMSGFTHQVLPVSYQPLAVWEPDNDGKIHIEKMYELIEMGFLEDAREEIKSISVPDKNSMDALFFISQLYSKAEAYLDSMTMLNRMLSRLKKNEQNLTAEFWRLFYPLNYWDIVSKTASENHIDSILILSVIRQESVFDRMSLSSANARGLMQLMPKTGERVYGTVVGSEFNTDLLFEPEINIKVGTHYLSELLRQYEGNLVLALAAYNAGPAPVRKWIENFGNIPEDEFIEKITYPETRGYVKKVLRNYENYKKLYTVQ